MCDFCETIGRCDKTGLENKAERYGIMTFLDDLGEINLKSITLRRRWLGGKRLYQNMVNKCSKIVPPNMLSLPVQ